MTFILDPQIIIPSFNEATSQLANLTLNKLGIDINSIPFWLSVIGYPLVMFEVFTKHIATAINILLRKAHINTIGFILKLIQLVIILSFFVTIGLAALYNSEYVDKVPNINSEFLTIFFKYIIIIAFVIFSVLLLSSLSYLTGQGNQVAGIGFLLGTVALAIEAIQNFGSTATIVLGITTIFGWALWHYGNSYNKSTALKQSRQENLIDGIQSRRKRLRNIQ